MIQLVRSCKRDLATSILADYASDDPQVLADLLMDSDAKAFVTLFPAIERLKDKAASRFQAEFQKKAEPDWGDAPLDPAWAAVGSEITNAFKEAGGRIEPRFAFCQTMDLGEFDAVKEGMTKSGYRLARFAVCRREDRPGCGDLGRDGLGTEVKWEQTAQGILELDRQYQKQGYIPTDVAGYVAHDEKGKPVDRYAATWVKSARRVKFVFTLVRRRNDSHLSRRS